MTGHTFPRPGNLTIAGKLPAAPVEGAGRAGNFERNLL